MKLKVAVVFGGASVEHEISVISANQVINALDKDKYEVLPIYITKDQDFYYSTQYNDLKNFKDLNKAIAMGTKIVFKKDNNMVEMHSFNNKMFGSSKINVIDIFFPVLHGTNGEDGTFQGLMNVLDATYTFGDTKASAVGQDKVFMKSILSNNGIKVVDFEWFYDQDYFNNEDVILDELEKKLHYPMIIKPANLGSSIGISKASNRIELSESIAEAFKYENKILVEKVIENLCEVNCAVLGDYSSQQTSAIEEVFQSADFLSYEDKYQAKGSKEKGMAATNRIIPANISTELENKVSTMAIQTFKILNLAGNTRIDFLIDKNTNEVYLNETNTIPGSLAFYLWQEKGIDFSTLCEDLIKLAIKRKREQKQLVTSFDSNVLKTYDEKGSKSKVK
jgi:D-alanine-D-alanine ligase